MRAHLSAQLGRTNLGFKTRSSSLSRATAPFIPGPCGPARLAPAPASLGLEPRGKDRKGKGPRRMNGYFWNLGMPSFIIFFGPGYICTSFPSLFLPILTRESSPPPPAHRPSICMTPRRARRVARFGPSCGRSSLCTCRQEQRSRPRIGRGDVVRAGAGR